jgi:hypothetical protein
MNRWDGAIIEMNIVLYPEGDYWIAQGLQFDITARGNTRQEAASRFKAKVGAEILISFEIGDQTPLSGVERAPQKFWDMFEEAQKSADADEAPMPLLGLPEILNAPRLVPHMRVSEIVPA